VGGAAAPPGTAARWAADPFSRNDPPVFALTLWPNRSLSPRGSGWLIGIAAAGFTMPLLALAGTQAAWGMLPFMVGALLLLYWAIGRSFRDGRLTEELRIWPDLITVVRREPKGTVKRWHANPFWVRARLHENAQIEKYLTLEGAGREIELGAFLSPWEREELHAEIRGILSRLRQPG
jgi:uncharacterized membrane protein